MDRPRLTHVAIRYNGRVTALPEPNRHSDIVYKLIREDPEIEYWKIELDGEFGFLDGSGRFLNRKQALVSADINDQIKDPTKVLQGMLFSEALW